MSAKPKPAPPIVLPVGGGKGGIGKSALAVNLALALARLEHQVTLIDADLGGSDLHNLLGQSSELPGLGEVLTSKQYSLPQVVRPVLESRFSFVPGDAMVVATANPSFQQKRKLLHAVHKLPASYVIMDLGAGTSITVMDFFLTSPLSVLVMLPERPAVLSAFNFLKNAVYRALERLFRQNSKTGAVLAKFRQRSRGPGAIPMREIIEAMDQAQPGEGARAQRALTRWRPKLVLNRVRRVDDFVYASQIERWAAEDLGLSLEVCGLAPEDEIVSRAAMEGRPALDLDPAAPFCRAVALLASDMAQWAGRSDEWAAHKNFSGSFERAATSFAPFFPPPGAKVPTRDELIKRLRELEAKLED